ncbi:metallophosphoesterase family protein [Leucobacter weissii]|uniref:Metallophosphoesterase family protein n=1 Tax=Leucobacter weissii TaxID=1983706 RepID=A0A939S7F3_9MICO|nr:metallophosphoesterase [Leucobacter weissii]MBO1900926.1 metallophosphoesterase family protein [Leucobacter weissii]
MARYWIADLHLGHDSVARRRGFETTEEHDDTVLGQLGRLRRDDVVWVLGDLTSGRPEEEQRALELLRGVDAELHLIAGNHDGVSSIHRRGYRHQREWLEVFGSVQQFGWVRLGGREVLMSHYPYESLGEGPGRGATRYPEFRLPDRGFPLIHGHTHQSTPQAPHPQTGGILTSMYCVSWEVHRDLVGERLLESWIANEHGGGAPPT